MSEQSPSTMPATDGKPATEYPVVAGAGESFDALDSSTPLSAGADSGDAEPGESGTGHDSADEAGPGGG